MASYKLDAELDWPSIRYRWEAGESARSIAADLGVCHSRIRRRAEREGWQIVGDGGVALLLAEVTGEVLAFVGRQGTKDAKAAAVVALRRALKAALWVSTGEGSLPRPRLSARPVWPEDAQAAIGAAGEG